MLHAEYPHAVTFLESTKVSDGGGGYEYLWTAKLAFNGFLDTPSSREIFEARQLENVLDRTLFYPYRTDVHTKMRCQCEGNTYELVGHPQDQGGQREIMRINLKLVAHE